MQKTKSFITDRQYIQGIKRKFLPLIFAFVLILTTAFFSAATAGQERLSVKVGAYANHPKIYMDDNGKVSGFWPDLMEDIAETENWEIEYVWGTWSDGLDHLINKEIAIMPDVAFTEKRNKLYAFSEDPVLMSWTRLYVSKENEEIQSITDLKNKKISALKGSVNLEGAGGLREIARGFNLNCTFLELDDYTEVFRAVEENRADAGITNRNFGNKNAKNFKVKKTPILFQPINMKFAFPKDTESASYLAGRINYHIRQLKQDENSIYYRLLGKYFEAEISEKRVEVFPEWLGTILKIIAALFAFFILVIIATRIQVKRKTKEIRIKNEALRESESRFRLLYERVPLGYQSLDKNGHFIDVNQAWLETLGYSREEVIGRSFSDFLHPDRVDDFKEMFHRFKTVGEIYGVEFKMIKEDGSTILVSFNGKISKDKEGNFLQTHCILYDITERKRADEVLRESEEKYSGLFDTMTSGVAVYQAVDDGEDFVFVDFNLAAEKIDKVRGKDIIGKRVTEAFPGVKEFGLFKVFQRVWKTGKPEYFPTGIYENERGPGAWRENWVYKLPSGEIVAVYNDITERKEAEKELRKYREHLEALVEERTGELEKSQQALLNLIDDLNIATDDLKSANERLQDLDRLKSMFIASMSHELRTPLNSIIGFTGIILQGMTGEINPEQEDQLQRVYGSAKHLLALINDVIDISKIETGKFEVHVDEFDLGEVIREAVSNLTPKITNKGLDLEITLPQETRLTTDRKRLLQCILNFLSNAVKFTEKGKISIIASEIDEMIEIAVKDTGIGMKEEDLPKLFGSFVRLDSALTIKTTGTGLGLYLTKKIATEMLGGEVSVESRCGEGSTFILKIPKEIA